MDIDWKALHAALDASSTIAEKIKLVASHGLDARQVAHDLKYTALALYVQAQGNKKPITAEDAAGQSVGLWTFINVVHAQHGR